MIFTPGFSPPPVHIVYNGRTDIFSIASHWLFARHYRIGPSPIVLSCRPYGLVRIDFHYGAFEGQSDFLVVLARVLRRVHVSEPR